MNKTKQKYTKRSILFVQLIIWKNKKQKKQKKSLIRFPGLKIQEILE